MTFPADLTSSDRALKSLLYGVLTTVLFMFINFVKRGPSLYLSPPRLHMQEEILKSVRAGYILDGRPVQGELILTNQRLIFRYPRDKYETELKQVEADRQEIDEVKLSGTHSAYRTGVTVQVKGSAHIFTVPLPERWVTDIRNVVMHGHTAN